ncbi:phage tail protein [Bradyrhizobium sp. P5_C12]
MDDPRKFEELVQFRAPANLSEAIDTAAKQRCQSKSDYIRQSVVDRLRSDGVNLHPFAGRALGAFFALALFASNALAAGTIPGISMTQQLDEFAKPLSGGKLFLIQAGTTAAPQNCYQDTGLTLAWPNPVTLDAAGRIPQLFCADGSIKVRLTDKNGNQKLVQDNLLIVGPSGGGGGGGTVDPTTIFQTGAFMQFYGTGVLSGWVRCNGRTIGNASSGATERANSDTQALFAYLWGADSNLAVGGGRGASAAADFSANKTLALPDCRGRVLASLDDMGNSAASRLTSSYFGSTATTLGAVGGAESQTLTAAQMPSHNHGVTDPGHSHPYFLGLSSSPGNLSLSATANSSSGATNTATTGITIQNTGGGSAHPIVQPTILATTYIKM